MSEEDGFEGVIQEIKEEALEEDEGFPCPHCGKRHKEYPVIGKIRSPRCPSCHKLIKADLIPEEYIVRIDRKDIREAKRKFPELYEEAEVEEDRGVKVIFPRLREPWMVLRDVLQYHGLKEEFIAYAVRKCKSKEALHPMELRHMLEDLDSGIKTKRQVEYIVNDYVEALYAEREKAERRGEMYPFVAFDPLSQSSPGGSYPTYRSSHGGGEVSYGYGYGYRGYDYYRGGNRYGYPEERKGDSGDVKEALTSFMSEMKQLLIDREREREIDELRKSQTEMMTQFRDMIMEMFNRQQEQINKLAEAIKESKGKGEDSSIQTMIVTLLKDMQKDQREMFERMERNQREALEKMMEKMETRLAGGEDGKRLLDEYKAETEKMLMKMLMEKRIEELSKKIDESKKAKEDERFQAVLEEIDKLKETIAEYARQPSGEYKDDAFRVLAESVDRFSRALEKKEPIKDLGEVLARILGAVEKEEMPPELRERVKETVSEVSDLLEQIGAEEYVAEE